MKNNYTNELYDDNAVGYIAQEVHKYIPSMATYDVQEDTWGLSNTTLIPYLHKAILQQQSIINDLKSSNDSIILENKDLRKEINDIKKILNIK